MLFSNFSVACHFFFFFFFRNPIFNRFLVSGRRGSTASEKKRSKSRARSKSPFRSFRWPKSKTRDPTPGSLSDDEENRSTLRKFAEKLSVMGLVKYGLWVEKRLKLDLNRPKIELKSTSNRPEVGLK